MNRMTTWALGGVFAAGIGAAALAHEGAHGDAPADAGKKVSLTGELIDTACFVAGGGEARGDDHAACGSKCLGSGIPAGLLPHDAKDAKGLRFLLTNPVPLAPYVGKTIRVEGTEFAEVHAIDVTKLAVKEDKGWKEIALKDEHHAMSEEKHEGH